MPIGNTLPIYLRSRTIAQILTFLGIKRLISIGHLLNHLKNDAFGMTSLRLNGIALKTDSKEKANICNRQIQSAFTSEDDSDPPQQGLSLFFRYHFFRSIYVKKVMKLLTINI